jgi:glutaredoxin
MARTILYRKADCPYCDAARRALAHDGAEVEEIDVTLRREVVPELLKLTRGRRVVPVWVDARGVHVAPNGGSSF